MISMKICVIPRRPAGGHYVLPQCDLALLGFGCIGDVCFDTELSGASDKLGEFARLTKQRAAAAVCGCRTDSRGLKRKSAAVAEGGRLVGITDMLHVVDGEEYKSGAYLGLYRLGGYKVGLCIDNDIRYPEDIRSLSLCGCNLVACLSEQPDEMLPLLIRAYAYLYGVPVVLCAGGVAYFAEPAGGIASSNQPVTLFETNPQNSYRLISSRVRGISEEGRADY